MSAPAHYPYLADPSRHPDYERRAVRVPTWESFEGRTQFTALRGFAMENGRLVSFREELDAYVDRAGLGRVIWPIILTVYAENFWDLVDEVKKRNLWLFDFWAYVPGSPMRDVWCNFEAPEGMVERLQKELGDRFLGFDNGEQDGRYIGRYATQQCPSPQDRYLQSRNFQRHFERLCDDLGNHMSTLVSLCFGHYFLKEGNHVLIGAETAQALPNSQVYYSFIRGAGKHYGVLWFGNASVWNRWGWKVYESSGKEGTLSFGPTAGTSTALLKRLLYSHWMYNCVAIGFESSWFGPGDEISPIGRIQAAGARFVDEHGSPGTMHTPVALMLDHFAGWAMPRHLYTGQIYQVWGAMPYGPGDHLTHGVLALLYPGYEDSSYFRDERGFLSPTPYGDMADCVLSDAAPWVLRQYGLVVLAGDLEGDAAGVETRDKLDALMASGGHVVAMAENARRLWPELGIGDPRRVPAGTRIVFRATGEEIVEPHAFDLCAIPGDRQEVVAYVGSGPEHRPAVVRYVRGPGTLTVVLSPFGLNAEPLVGGPIANEPEKSLACPFVLLDHVRRAIGDAFAAQQLFAVGDGLAFVTCRKSSGEYTISVFNNGLDALPFRIESRAGRIASIRELPIDQSEKGAEGYWPDGRTHDGGLSDDRTIAGNDVRIFSVTVAGEEVRILPAAEPPTRPKNRFLRLPADAADLKGAILRMPTFFQHFDGVLVDWTAIHGRDAGVIDADAGWLGRQKLRIAVDFSSGSNLFPDLTLIDTIPKHWDRTLAAYTDVFAKMAVLGAKDAVVELHIQPENHVGRELMDERLRACVGELCRRAAEKGIAIHLRPHPHKWNATAEKMRAFAEEIGATNVRVAADLCHGGDGVAGASMVLVSAPLADAYGQQYDAHLPVAGSSVILAVLGSAPAEAILVLDAQYADWDAVYRDVRAVDAALAARTEVRNG